MPQLLRHVRRGSYFFAIDAFIATILIVAAILILYSKQEYAPPSTQAFSAANDYLLYIEASPIGYLDSPVVREWIANQTINDTQATILYQLAVFNVTNEPLNMTTLANLSIQSVPPQVGIEVLVGGVRAIIRGEDREAAAPVMVILKRIIIVRTGSAQVVQPVVVEVRAWQ